MQSKTPNIIRLKRGKAGPSMGRHPWIFSNAIESVEGNPEDGDEVHIFENDGRFIASGFFNSKSSIRVRLYSWNEGEALDENFFRRKLSESIHLREDVLQLKNPRAGVRLVFSEADGMSGLIVDRFASFLSVQMTSLALAKRKEMIASLLRELCQPKGIMISSESNVARAEGFEDSTSSILIGDAPQSGIEIEENGLKFLIDFHEAQKTGFYLDQRDNRLLLRNFVSGKRVLDLCSYTGGFALSAALGGAKSVIAVDSSQTAIAQAKQNAERNGIRSIEFVCADLFDFLRSRSSDEKFDVIILDPPRLAPNRSSKSNALRTYFKMNEQALKAIVSGGIFLSCSCSGQISSDEFGSMLSSVARRSKRSLRFLYKKGAAPDHPVSSACPETNYLKAFFSYVD